MARATEPTVIVGSAARTTSGDSGGQSCGQYAKLAILINVTAFSGTTPTINFTVEWSHDKTTYAAANTSDAFTQIVGVSARTMLFDTKGPYYRLVWAVAGTTPSFTFTASQYAIES